MNKCIACVSVGYKEGCEEKSSGACELLPCPRCSEPLYCSEACAEIGWYYHRSFCSGPSPPVCAVIYKNLHAEREQALISELQSVTEGTNTAEVDFCHLLQALEDAQPLDELSEETRLLLSKITGIIEGSNVSVNVFERSLSIVLQARIMSAFLGDCDGALVILRKSLAWLLSNNSLEGASHCTLLLQAERMNVWTRKYPNVVLSPSEDSLPLSSRVIACGNLVAKDSSPLLVWNGCGFPPLLFLRRSSTYDDSLRAMRDSFLELCDDQCDGEGKSENDLSTVLGAFPALHEVNADAAITIESYLREIRKDMSASIPCWLSNLFAMALLSGRPCGTNRWGVFDLASRLRHSCAPNCVWDGAIGTLRAVRSIVAHEPLTLTVFWGPPSNDRHQLLLKLPAHMRKEAVRAITGVSCACARCVGAPSDDTHISTDTLRGFPCPLCKGDRGWRYRSLPDAAGGRMRWRSPEMTREEKRLALRRRLEPWEPWRCARCGERWGDAEMPIQKETELCRRGERIVIMAQRGAVGPNFFEEVKTLMQDTLLLVGKKHHSAYLLACEAMVLFYRYIARRFTKSTHNVAQSHIVMWCRKWIRCAVNTGLIRDCPHIYASFLVETALSLTDVALVREKITILRHAESQCPIATAYESDNPHVAAVSSLIHDSKSPTFTLMARAPSAFTTFMNAEEQDGEEDELIKAWERHLMERVYNEVQSNENPNIPHHLAQALHRN